MTAYRSKVPVGMPVIGDGYSAMQDDLINPTGYGKGYIPRNYSVQPYDERGASRFYDVHPPLPKEALIDRIADMEANRSQIYHSLQDQAWPVKNQLNTNYCWSFGVTTAAMITRDFQGQPFVDLSPASLAAPLVNFLNRGGWGDQAAKGSLRNGSPGGWVPTEFWPDTSRDRNLDNEETRAMRIEHCTLEFWEFRPRDMLSLVTALVNRIPCGVGFDWWGHLVTAVGALWLDDWALVILNSWGQNWGQNGYGVLEGRKAIADGIVSIRSPNPR